ncbi:MAG: hypothetical protein J6X12_05835, partial [Paludibacteraceae bacterium]|nr:hypothetical protein [Paludibacteraceae bacterium]
LMNKENLKLNLYRVDFVGNTTCIQGSGYSEIVVDSCRFEKNVACGSNGGAITSAYDATLIVRNSIFNQCNTCNYGGAIISSTSSNVYVENSTFDNCYAYAGSAIYLKGTFAKLHSVNSTYVNNTGSSVIYESSGGHYFELYNNTILSNALENGYAVNLQNYPSLKMVGNVIESISVTGFSDSIISRNNIFMCDLDTRGNVFTDENEKDVLSISASDCSDLFDGEYDSKNDKFEASLKDNGGFTPTIALKSDKLSDSKSIRFPRLDDVLTDQRGVSRMPMACMGAYEIGCGSDTTFSVDTVQIGTKIYGQTFTKLGVHDSIFENLKNAIGCDSIVMHKVIVTPDPTKLNYYVKMKKDGDGDGRDWENAMDGEDFALYLPLAPEGATFYVAAGTYMPHPVYSKIDIDNGVCFSANAKDISIIGGYSAEIKSETQPEPQKYETIFRSEDKSERCFVSNSTKCYGLVFESSVRVGFSENLLSTFEKCTFRGIDTDDTYYKNKCVVYHNQTENSVIEFKECIFLKNKTPLLQGFQTPFDIGVDKYYNCTFVENEADYFFAFPGIYTEYGNFYEFENCTFFKNKANFWIFSYYGGLRLYNCSFFDNEAKTFLSDSSFDSNESSILVGNVFLNNKFTSFFEGTRRTSSEHFDLVSHNLFQSGVTGLSDWSDNINLSDAEKLEKDLFETDSKDEFVLKNNGGFTPTVALKKDVLADGTSIRFPRLENVLTDQRGVTRLDSTCMGAYEIKCSPVVTELKDTVFVGDSYSFNGSDLDDVCQNVGSYYFSDTLTGSGGCDSIVNLSLAVRPQKRETGYYVKVDGTGDGSDWENAMSPKDFAEYLPLVNDGETFHIAAGTYKSTYVDPELGRMFNINSSVSLIGGYPDTVTVVGVPPMPENFTTTLSADVKGRDNITIYKERPGDYSISGFANNDSILIRVNGTPTVSLYGISLSGVKSDNYGAVTMNDGGTLNLDKCSIVANNASGIVASNAKINVTSTLAYQNIAEDGAVFRLTDSELNVEHSSFHENISSGESADSKGAVANLTNSQATFTNNTVANNWADMGGVFALSNSQVSLVNNTLVGNQSIAKEPKGSFVSASDTKSKVSLFGNMIVGNGAQPVDGAAVESEGYNIFSTDFQGSDAKTDMFMGSKDYEFIIDGKPLSDNADVFIASVNDNGGFTPTVAVVESMFDGGAVISIPSDQRKVNFDQREMVRKDTSCVGAFEFPTYVNYFVKQSPLGDGTGRDWDNAMGDTTFFRYFSIVPSGATFHVAAGTYRPLADRLYNLDSYKDRKFYSSRPLNVFGGYHPQAQIGAVADPSKYVTLLSSDFKGDDQFTESTGDYSVLSYSNYKDNSSYVMTIMSKSAGDVQLKGLTFSGNYTQFRGSSSALTVSSVDPEIHVALSIDSCSFEKTYVGIYSYVDSLFIRGCRFDTILYLGLYHSPRETVPSVLEIENSSFTNMSRALSVFASNGKVLLQNSTFNNAIGLVDINSSSYNKTVDLSLEMYHNTFGYSPKSYQGIVVPNFVQTTAKGNIFNTNFLVTADNSGTNAMKQIVSDYNLFVEEPDTTYGAWFLGENDMLVSPSDLKGVVPGEMGEKRFHAVSSLEKPENYTKVVALESDV